jgi:Uma2 family endonuclease
MVVRHRMTADEYLALPEEKPYLEYICGEVVPKSVPDYRHADLVHALDVALDRHMRLHGGKAGPEGRILFQTALGEQFRLPDLSYWAAGRPRLGARAMQPPTLAVEVRSPDESLESQREKCRFYQAHGVDVSWLLDPDSRTVEVFEGGRDGDAMTAGLLTSPHLPGFALDVAELFGVLDS